MKEEGLSKHKSFDIFAESKKTAKLEKEPKQRKKRKGETPKAAPVKKKTKTDEKEKSKNKKKQGTLFDHFKKGKEKKDEDKPITIAEKLLNIVDVARALKNDRSDPEYWAHIKKIVSALVMNTAKYRDHLFKVTLFPF